MKHTFTTFASLCGFVAALACLNYAAILRAADPAPPPAVATTPLTNAIVAGLSAGSTTNRAAWQQRLTLGPSDEISISLYGDPMPPVIMPIGLDGRINFLQVRDFVANGMTVDELRTALDQALAKYYLAPRTMISPVNMRSKHYYILGKVAGKGVFTLDRPKSIIEAVAQAGGLQLGTADNSVVELADLGRSFLTRGGKRVPVDFESLFQRGDLNQNALLEPEDYLFFASANASEIYVLGEVLRPGPASYVPDASVLAAIASRGGFKPGAYKQKVLVVRGSLTQPETFIVDVASTFKANRKDFHLEARDIVYVSQRPWYKVEQLLDLAIDSYVYGVTYQAARDLSEDLRPQNR